MPGHARTPGRHHSLGGPLPRQLANTTTARPTAPELWCRADAGPARRWGLPAVSRGYTRPWGWLPSPYSPFRHWPDPKTGPVRLACLIHAANVHSEPGSNPSKMVRHGFAGPKARFPRRRSPPRKVEEKQPVATSPVAARPEGRPVPALIAGPCCPSRRLGGLRTAEARRPGTTARTPAPLKGPSHAKRVGSLPLASSLLASRFLADECNPPDCQRSSRSTDA